VVSQFRQLFQNLISNSLKFVSEDVAPRIDILHSYLEPEQVGPFQLKPADRYLRIQMSDNGIGFEKENAGKIFLLFQRLHGRSEYEGSGIGLSICKKIVEHHGGIIYAESELGKGAKFTIILPATHATM
jgi:signal transduction histidine kinase